MERRGVLRLGAFGYALILCIAVSQLIYAGGWGNGLVSDDWRILYKASDLGGGSLRSILSPTTSWFYRPVELLLTRGLHLGFGLEPTAYHVVSQVLDLCDAAAVALLSFLLFSAHRPAERSTNLRLAGVAAVLFLFSWRHHQAVFWYSAVNEPLATSFKLGALVAIALWARGRIGFLAAFCATLSATILALLTKESAVTLPLESALLVVAFAAGDLRGERRRCLWIIGAQLAAVVGWIVLYSGGTSLRIDRGITRSGLVVAVSSAAEWVPRLAQFLNANWLFTRLLSEREALLLGEALALVLLSVLAFRRRQVVWLFALAWAVVASLPYAWLMSEEAIRRGVPLLASGTEDRFLYHSAAGASLLVVASWRWVEEALAPRLRPQLRVAGCLLLVAYLAACGERLHSRGAAWREAGDLTRRVLAQSAALVHQAGRPDSICLVGFPDNRRGAFVLRHGAPWAISLLLQRSDLAVEVYATAPLAESSGKCGLLLSYDEVSETVSPLQL